MRQTLADEFASIHICNLRGNARTAGEQRKKEGDGVFESGSRATVAITMLVKQPGHLDSATIHYTDIGDYLSRADKLTRIAEVGTVAELQSVAITPNEFGDWVHQRAQDFETFMPLGGKGSRQSVVSTFSSGLKTNRDAWVYNSGRERLAGNTGRLAQAYNEALGGPAPSDPSLIAWSGGLRDRFERGEPLSVDPERTVHATYRPFQRTCVYFDATFNERRYRLPRIFPTHRHDNVGFYQVGAGSAVPFSVLMVEEIPDLHVTGAGSGGQLFPRWTWVPVAPEDGTLDFGSVDADDSEVVDGYRRLDNVTDEALARWRTAYGKDWSKDDVFYYCYGLLHSIDYRETYAADLKKMLPRIPLVATATDARAFADAGRRLAELHVGYEQAVPYPLDGFEQPDAPAGDAAFDFYAVGATKMRFGGKGKAKDRTVIHYNDRITVSDIPEEAYRYELGSRSAIEWIIDRYHVKIDKASGIVNDPNDWSREVGDPRYILDLLARVVTVSLETMKIVDELPPLTIRDDSP